jgi:SM-20-related protein
MKAVAAAAPARPDGYTNELDSTESTDRRTALPPYDRSILTSFRGRAEKRDSQLMTSERIIDSRLFACSNFLSIRLCQTICEQMQTSCRKASAVLGGKRPFVDERTRSAKNVTVAAAAHQVIASHLQVIAPQIAQYFGCTLAGLRELQFLAYDNGDFFVFHRDKTNALAEPPRISARKVSVVIFLNDPILGSYSGGALEFYAHDLVGIPMYEQVKASFTSKTGTLVAFSPLVRHQVQPVTHGHRFTVVTWFV